MTLKRSITKAAFKKLSARCGEINFSLPALIGSNVYRMLYVCHVFILEKELYT